LPFFTFNNTLDIVSGNWDEMGTCWLAALTDLQHANGATRPISVSIFAWAENVEFSVPTQFNPVSLVNQSLTLENQSGDEYAQGKLSKPATVVAKVASWFRDVPVIGKYARATEMGAGLFAKTAAQFGYCKPLDLDKVYVEPTAKGSMATVNEKETAIKLSIDSK
jgi:hypothetical protein